MCADIDIEKFLAENERKELLRFSTAGSIDDGKSTLIGRLLHDSKNIYEDQLAAVRDASGGRPAGDGVDFALVTDGLKSEREQGITIDVAYRYFSTPRRKFIIADTPGHVQYTRNMATGASTANLAVVLVDARNGVLPQTKRHAFITSLLGVPHMVVAINKMDLVGYDEAVYEQIKSDFVSFSGKLRVADVRFIPMSALEGDNVVTRSRNMPWYRGESLLEILETVHIASDHNLIDLRFPIQYVIRPNQDFRGYGGVVVSGIIRPGDEIMALPSMKVSRVASLVTFDGELDEAYPPMSVAVTLEDELDISRGDMLVHRHNLPRQDRHFEAMVVWMNDTPMDLNRAYYIKHTSQMTRARIDALRYKVDVNTLKRSDGAPLALNDIGRAVFTAHRPVFCDAYEKNRGTGCFILIDAMTNNTAACGMVIDREPEDQLPARMATQRTPDTMHHRESRVTPEERRARLGQKPATVWLTGLVGSGKTEIAYALEKRLFELGGTCMVLDGENVRMGLSAGLDFTAEGRSEHLRRVAELARMINEAGLIAVCGFVSPTDAIRRQIADITGHERFLEIHVDATAAWCEARDVSGLYKKARAGVVQHLAGVSLPYEAPADPALRLPRESLTVDEAVDRILDLLRDRGVFPA